MNWLKRLFGTGNVTQPPEPQPKQPDAAAMLAIAKEALNTSAPDEHSRPSPDFPFPLVAVRGADAEREWRRYQAEWRQQGASAVLIGDEREVAQFADAMKFNEASPESTLAIARTLSAESFFAERKKQAVEEESFAEQGNWPGAVPGPDLGAHLDILSKRPKPRVFLARVPTVHVWEIPAYLKFGGWNACPAPEEHVAVLRHWAAKYGIEIYAITGDVVECTVAHPPETQAAAMTLAEEQFLYCSDIVHQGVDTLCNLGATLQDSAVWYFWWD